MRCLMILILLTGTANAAYIDLAGDGGTASYNGTTLMGIVDIKTLTAVGISNAGTYSTLAELTFTNTTFTLTGTVNGVATEVLETGTFSGIEVIHPDSSLFTFVLGVGTGSLSPALANFFGISTVQASGLSVTVDGVGSTNFANGTVSSTDFTIGQLTVVPEPSSILLCGISLAFGVIARKRNTW